MRHLEQDGRISNADLAKRVGLSPSACLRRVQEMERNGTIRGYRAVLDRTTLDAGFTVFTAIALADHKKSSQRDFEDVVRKAPQVRECHNVAGSFEYLLRVEVADLAAYKAFHTNVLGTISALRSITSYVSMDTVKDERG